MLILLASVLSTLMVRVALWRANVALRERQQMAAQRWLWVSMSLNWAPWLTADRAETHYLQAKVWRRSGQLERVAEALNRAKSLNFDQSLLEREQSFALAQDGQFQRLGRGWGRLFLESGSDAPELADAYVTFCCSRFRLAEADQVLASWEADFPEDHRPHWHRGRMRFVLQEWDACLLSLERATQLAPSDVATRLLKAQAHAKLLQFAEAEVQLAVALRWEPHNATALILLAICQSHRDDVDGARQSLQHVLAQAPGNFEALRELGLLELKWGHFSTAQEVLQRAVVSHEEDAELRHALAKALTATGRASDAEAHFAFQEEAAKPLLRLPELTTRLSRQPQDVELRHAVARIVWTYRSRADGLLWLKSTLEFAPAHAATHALLAEHYRLVGKHELARQHAAASGDQP